MESRLVKYNGVEMTEENVIYHLEGLLTSLHCEVEELESSLEKQEKELAYYKNLTKIIIKVLEHDE